jgi:O-antigen/teichoic acid export membrane protein
VREPVTAALLARNATRSLVALSVPPVVALVSMPLLVARLDAAQFGVLGLIWACFGLFAELGLERGMTKYAAAAFARGSDARAVVRVGVLLQLALGLALAAALAIAAIPLAARLARAAAIATELRTVLYIIAAALPIITVSAAYRGVLEAAHRFDLSNGVRLVVGVATYLLPAVLVMAGAGVVPIALVLACVRGGATLAYRVLAHRLLRAHTAAGVSEAPAVTKPMLSYGAWQSVSAVLSSLLVYVDRLVLGGIAGVAAVGLYTPAFEMATRLLLVPASIVMALFPAFSAWTGDDAARSARTAARAVLYVTVALVPLVALGLGLGTDVLALWLNTDFAERTGVVLGILCCGALVNAAAYVPVTLLQGIGRPDIPARLYAIQLPLYIALLAWLVSGYGVLGAAVACTIRVSVDAALLFAATHRLGVLPLSELVHARVPQALGGAAVLALAPATIAATLPTPWLRIALTSAALAASGVFLWTYALRAQGRARIAQAFGLASS